MGNVGMKYGSVCSGIEASTAAWHPLGWEPAFFSEIEKFPREALKYIYPEIPLHGDFTTIEAGDYEPIRLICGGTPCQSFSVAGLRAGMADNRGNLALEFTKLAYRLRTDWVAWENVPGVFSVNGGKDFAAFLSSLAGWEIPVPGDGWKNSGVITPAPGGYGLAWRVLDAQYFGVPQRRRRVFVIGYSGAWQPAAAVLLERESLRRNNPPGRQPQQGTAPDVTKSIRDCSGGIDREDVHTLIRAPGPGLDLWNGNYTGDTAHTMQSGPKNESPALVPHVFDTTQITSGENRSNPQPGDPCHPLSAGAHPPAIAFTAKDYGQDATEEVSPTLRAGGHSESSANGGVMPAVAFKPSHYTRGKDGAPSEVFPPLSADADKGDQEAVECHGTQDPIVSDNALPLGRNSGQENVVFQPRYVRNGRGAPDDIIETEKFMDVISEIQ